MKSHQSVQIVRSAFTRDAEPLHEFAFALKRAIAAAEQYIYVEDQFLCDYAVEHLGLPIPATPRAIPSKFSPFIDIAERMIARPHLKVIFVGSGESDPTDFWPGRRNRRYSPTLRELLRRLPLARQENLAVWRFERVTVHSKLVLIDDEFASIGSGNFRKRAFFGVDTELQVAFIAADERIKRLRMALWAELFGLETFEEVMLADLGRALGHWHPRWSQGATLPSSRRRMLAPVGV